MNPHPDDDYDGTLSDGRRWKHTTADVFEDGMVLLGGIMSWPAETDSDEP